MVICRFGGADRRAQITEVGDGNMVSVSILNDGLIEQGLRDVAYAETVADRKVDKRWWLLDTRRDLERFFADSRLGDVLRPPMCGIACRNVRDAMRYLGHFDLPASDQYDTALAGLILRFQKLHEYPSPDGLVGPVTRSLLVQQLLAQANGEAIFSWMEEPTVPARPAGSPPTNETPMTRDELWLRFSTLLPGQFDDAIIRANIPLQYLPGSTASQATRAAEAFRYMEQQNRLEELARIIRQIASGLGSAGAVPS